MQGLGMYDLGSEEAEKTGEAEEGVSKIVNAKAPPEIMRLLGPWKDAVAAAGEGKYPGSPRVAHGLLRKIDRLSLYELHEEDIEVLAASFKGDYQTRVNAMDGWLVPVTHIPPKEGRGLILVDPPFEDGKDFDRMIDLLTEARKRWPGATVALWYPVKKREHTDEWLGTLKDLKFPDLLNAEIYVPRTPFV